MFVGKPSFIRFFRALIAVAQSISALAATNSLVTLTPSADTSIIASGENPQGDQTILSGTRGTQSNGTRDRGLLRFDLSSIPTNAVIQSVVLRLNVVMIPGTHVASNFGLYRMLTTWDQGATWQKPNPRQNWGIPGAQEGIDYTVDSSAAQFVDEIGEYDLGPSDSLTGDIKDWIADPGSNKGWLLLSDDEADLGTARHFGSSESPSPPQLLIEYSSDAAIDRPELKNVQAKNGIFSFSFDASAGHAYRVEARQSFESGVWATVTNFPPATATSTLTVTTPSEGARRCCRVVVE